MKNVQVINALTQKAVNNILEKTEPTGNETKTQRRFCYSCFALLRAGIYYHEGYIANQFLGGKCRGVVGKFGRGVGGEIGRCWVSRLGKKTVQNKKNKKKGHT